MRSRMPGWAGGGGGCRTSTLCRGFLHARHVLCACRQCSTRTVACLSPHTTPSRRNPPHPPTQQRAEGGERGPGPHVLTHARKQRLLGSVAARPYALAPLQPRTGSRAAFEPQQLQQAAESRQIRTLLGRAPGSR